MALHTGEADLRAGDYYGSAVNRCARLRAIAHGGSDVTADLVRETLRDGLRLRDLGQRRLKDLTAPERVYQLAGPTLPDDFPPPRSLDAVPNNLPLQLTSLVGREAELADVEALLSRARLVTLTGAGGAGKTRLALQVAADLTDGYPDGVWFVDLAPLVDPTFLPQAVLTALGLREVPGRPQVTLLLEHLGVKRSLLVLDNCEHLVEASARLAEALVRQCPHLSVLATSRELLGLAGEIAWRVPPLSLPEPATALAELERSGAVRLFVERARAVDPSFAVTAASVPALGEICRRLDGIPLAIELAAARVRVLTVEQIAARLDDRFRLLTGGSRTALRRQKTLLAAVDWSHDLLSEPERVLLRRLAVFAGGWTLGAAEAVCADAPTGGIGSGGTWCSTCSPAWSTGRWSAPTGPAPRSGTRLLETIRQYALEKLLASDEALSVRGLHRDYYLEVAERSEPELHGPQPLHAFARIEAEHDNTGPRSGGASVRPGMGRPRCGSRPRCGASGAGAATSVRQASGWRRR